MRTSTPTVTGQSNRKSPESPSNAFPRESQATLLALLAVLSIVPYLNTLFNGFVYDDTAQILGNPYLKSFRFLREIFATPTWSFLGAWKLSNYYRPMMTFGYLLCYRLFGPVAYGFHLVNLLLNAGVVLLVFKVTERLFGKKSVAIFASAVFALHPIHTEAVAWIAAVTELELGLFYLLTFWFFLIESQPAGRRSDLAYVAMTASFILTLISKEQALTLPALTAIYEHFYRTDRDTTTFSQKVSRYRVLWLLAFGYILFRIFQFGAFAPFLQRPNVNWYEVVLSAAALFGQYVWKMFWPADLCAFYVFRKSTSLHDPRTLAGIGIVIGCILAFWWLWQHARIASFGVLWFVLTLGPVLNPRWMAASVFTERYLYLPSVGFCWIMAWGAVRLWDCACDWKRSLMWRRTLVSVLVLTGLLCLTRIVTRNRVWRDDLTLYTKTLEAEPDAMLIHTYLGITYWNRGYVGEAEKHWNEVLERFPNSVMDLNFMGWVRVRQKRYAEADNYFRRALHSLPTDPEAHLNLAGLSKEMGRIDDAELHLRAAVALAPMNSGARNLLGELYLERERLADAEEQFQRSVANSPNAKGYNGLGEVYVRRHEEDRAEQAFKVAVGLDPFDSQTHFALGRLYAKQGDVTRATREYQLGLQTDPQNREASAALEGLKKRIRHANPPTP